MPIQIRTRWIKLWINRLGNSELNVIQKRFKRFFLLNILYPNLFISWIFKNKLKTFFLFQIIQISDMTWIAKFFFSLFLSCLSRYILQPSCIVRRFSLFHWLFFRNQERWSELLKWNLGYITLWIFFNIW